MDDSDICEVMKRKARLQRAGRIGIALFFLGMGLFMSAAAIGGFDASHAEWQDYLIFILPMPWLVISGMVFAYRPKSKIRGGETSPSKSGLSSSSIFRSAVGLVIFGGLSTLLSAPNWRGLTHSLIITVCAVFLLLLLSRILKKTPSKAPADTQDATH